MHSRIRVLALVFALSTLGCATGSGMEARGEREARDLGDAARLMQDKQPEEAMKALRKVLDRSPESLDAMRMYVEAGFRCGQIGQVLADLARLLEIRPDSPNCHYGMGVALYAQSAAQESQALSHLERAHELAPVEAEFLFRIGLIHLDAERFGEAKEALSQARDRNPKVSRHYISLAQAQARSGDRKGALDSLRAVLDLAPRPTDLKVAEDVITRLNLPFREVPKVVAEEFERGLNFMQVDAPQQAMVTFQEILQKFPDLAGVHAALGLCFHRIDDSSRAIEELRYAIELSPEDPLNHLYLADVYYSKERFDRAVEGYKAVVEQDPLNVHAYGRLGQMALQISDFAQAKAWLKRLVTLQPKDRGARLSLGAALVGDGDLDGAEAIYAGLLKEDSKDVESLMRMGLLFLERRKLEETNPEKARALGDAAAKWFEKVLDVQPQNVFAARMLQSLAGSR